MFSPHSGHDCSAAEIFDQHFVQNANMPLPRLPRKQYWAGSVAQYALRNRAHGGSFEVGTAALPDDDQVRVALLRPLNDLFSRMADSSHGFKLNAAFLRCPGNLARALS